jgi:hypothetical protein
LSRWIGVGNCRDKAADVTRRRSGEEYVEVAVLRIDCAVSGILSSGG